MYQTALTSLFGIRRNSRRIICVRYPRNTNASSHRCLIYRGMRQHWCHLVEKRLPNESYSLGAQERDVFIAAENCRRIDVCRCYNNNNVLFARCVTHSHKTINGDCPRDALAHSITCRMQRCFNRSKDGKLQFKIVLQSKQNDEIIQ